MLTSPGPQLRLGGQHVIDSSLGNVTVSLRSRGFCVLDVVLEPSARHALYFYRSSILPVRADCLFRSPDVAIYYICLRVRTSYTSEMPSEGMSSELGIMIARACEGIRLAIVQDGMV
jgi:hypothetical protein